MKITITSGSRSVELLPRTPQGVAEEKMKLFKPQEIAWIKDLFSTPQELEPQQLEPKAKTTKKGKGES